VLSSGLRNAFMVSTSLLPISAVVPTRNRAVVFRRTLESLAKQTFQPLEIICIDASDDLATKELFSSAPKGLGSKIIWLRAKETGAASQRNEGVAAATQPVL